MDITIPYLRTQAELLAEIKALVRDPTPTRWTNAEYYTALNQVLASWAENVKFLHVYTISGGWVAGTYEYALPSYMRPPFYPELYRTVPFDNYITTSLTSNWQDLPGWEVVSDGAGGQVIRLYAPPRNVQGQVGFYSPNGRVPTTATLPVTSGSTSASATTMLLSTVVDVDEVGYVKVDSEWMAYYGVTRGTSTTTLNNLLRGLNGTTAAIHNTATTVYWGVAVDDLRLWKLLFDMWKGCLAEYFLQGGGVRERSAFQQNVGYYAQLAANFWPTYAPHRKSQGLKPNQRVFALR